MPSEARHNNKKRERQNFINSDLNHDFSSINLVKE